MPINHINGMREHILSIIVTLKFLSTHGGKQHLLFLFIGTTIAIIIIGYARYDHGNDFAV